MTLKAYGRICKRCSHWWAAPKNRGFPFEQCPNCGSTRIKHVRHVRAKSRQFVSGQVLKQMARRTPTPTPRVSAAPLLHTVCLYRHYDDSGVLLYVGITGDAPGRFRQHYATQPWRAVIATSTYEHYATREEALLAEAWAITTERPLHNRQQPVPTRPRPTPVSSTPPAMPPLAKSEGSDGGKRDIVRRDAADRLGAYSSASNPPRGTSDLSPAEQSTPSDTGMKPQPNSPRPRSPVDRITRLSPRLLASRITQMLKAGWPPGSADDG